VPAFSRLLAQRRHDLDRAVARDRARGSRELQLCLGRRTHAPARGARGTAAAARESGHDPALAAALGQSLFGGVCAFVAGLIALKWLSAWLEQGRWYLFGIYCLLAAGVVEALYRVGY
jgi:hypothetical protein